MIRPLLEGSKFILLLLVLFSCKKQKTENAKEYLYQKVVINDQLKKEITSYKEDLRKMDASESNNLSLFFLKKKDSIFIEMGDFEPNFKMVNIKGVEIIKNDTIYLLSEDKSMDLQHFYHGSVEKVKIIDSSKPSFSYSDPHYRCFYFDGKEVKILSYNSKCR
ncbi:hypothetical protein F3J23_11910 [Chryseobacterium sp. Tr-659]|uniref:hypothetical protein n=1 Tax=Chryseobacterium sp. Tr-659 TaxID=2608340 RepID=UPI0014231F33|nr:hypothetical protein [Chryseobacterium sp. Tr-659]NIF06146.1 hypothetical protein [Chryseobacterium sp. Tr-659]